LVGAYYAPRSRVGVFHAWRPARRFGHVAIGRGRVSTHRTRAVHRR